MEIIIKMELTEKNLDKLKVFTSAEQGETERLVYAAVPEAPQAPADTSSTPDTSVEPEKEITKTDIRAVALKLSKAGKQDVLAEIFKKFGCKKLSDFDSRTEDYPALMKELVSANG